MYDDDEDLIWQQRAGENATAFNAFQQYLKLRCVKKVAELIQKSYSATRRLASKYDWRERARAFDNNNLEETRQKIIAESSERLFSQWQQCIALQDAAVASMSEKDFTNVSVRTLTDLWKAAVDAQMKLVELLKVLNGDESGAKKIDINIVAMKNEGDVIDVQD